MPLPSTLVQRINAGSEWTSLLQVPISAFGVCASMVAMSKQLIRGAIKIVTGIALVVFLLARMTTNAGLLFFVCSIFVLLVCLGC